MFSKLQILALSVVLTLGTLTQAAPSQKEQARLCKMTALTLKLKKSRFNNGKTSDGVIFTSETKLANGFQDQLHSGLKLSNGQVIDWYDQPDILAAQPAGSPQPMLFLARSGFKDYDDPDNAQAGIYKVEVDDKRNGVVCSQDTSQYAMHYFDVSEEGMYCVRARHPDSQGHFLYGVIQVSALCKDGMVFNWEFNPSGNNIFSADPDAHKPLPVRMARDIGHGFAAVAKKVVSVAK